MKYRIAFTARVSGLARVAYCVQTRDVDRFVHHRGSFVNADGRLLYGDYLEYWINGSRGCAELKVGSRVTSQLLPSDGGR